MFGKLTICDSSGRNPLTNPYVITQQFTYVGKDKDCDIRFENPNCAGKQFLLTASGNGLVKIQNLSKKYATQVNQKPIGFQVDHELKEQDTISAAGRTIMWSYKTSAAESLPYHSALKRTRHSEPVRKVAVVTPNRREQTVDEEESLPPTKRRKTLYGPSVRSYTSHDCLHVPVRPEHEQSSFARRLSYDKMLKGRATPSHKGRLSSGAAPRRLAGTLRTPRGSAKKKTSFAHSLDSPRLIYSHDTAFNNSITPRTFYAAGSSSAPFTFRGFNPVPEESNSSILPEDSSFLSVTESNARDRRSGRVSTPLPKKRLTSPFLRSARTSRNKSILTGTPSVYFPTIQEGRLMESDRRLNSQHKESYLYENTETLPSLNDANYSRDSTPASYFSPTSSGIPRMMRAESPNIQHNANGTPRSPYQGRRSLMSSNCSSPFGTPQEVFHQSQQHDSLFVNTSGSSQIRQGRSQGSFLIDKSHYGSHDSILQTPQSLSFNTPSHLNTPRRSRSVIETPGSSSFSPVSYRDTEYVLLSPRGRNIVNKRYGRRDQSSSNFSQSPYSPSQNTLDFTASPPQHHSPRFARTPKRSLSVQVLTKSLQKKADYGFSTNSPPSPKARKSRGMAQAKSNVLLSRSSRTLVSTSPSPKPSRKSLKENLALEPDSKSPRPSQSEHTSHRVSRRSLTNQYGSPTHVNTGKSTNRGKACSEEISTPGVLQSLKPPITLASDRLPKPSTRKSSRLSLGEEGMSNRASRRSLSVPSGPTQSSSAHKSRKSENLCPVEIPKSGALQTIRRSGTFVCETDSDPSARKSSRPSHGEEGISGQSSRRSRSAPFDTPTQLSSARKSRKSGSVPSEEISTPGALQAFKRSGAFASETDSKPMTKKPRPSLGEKRISNRASRRSRSVPSGTPTQSSPDRKSRKNGLEDTEDSLEPVVPTSPKRSGLIDTKSVLKSKEGTSPSCASRRSLRGQSDIPAHSTISGKSRKSGNVGPQEISSPGGRQTPKRSGTFVLEDDSKLSAKKSSRSIVGEESLSVTVSQRSHSVGAPSQSSSPRKSKMIDEKNAEEILESTVPLTPNSGSQGEEQLSSRVPRRSRSVPAGTPTQSRSARKTRKSATGNNGEPSFPSVLSLSDEKISPHVSAVQPGSTCSSRKSGLGSTGDGVIEPNDPVSPKRLNSPRKTRSGTEIPENSKSNPRLTVFPPTPPKLSGSAGKKNTSTNLTESSTDRDIKPVLSENGTIEWPVTVLINTSSVTASSYDVKPLGSVCALRSRTSVESPTLSFARELRGSSTRLDESASSIANISAIPKSSRKTEVMVSTPDTSNSKKSVRITSTPFPKGLVSGQNGTRELSSDSTLPIEIDTINIHGNYISSDSPDYDKITDEELFDLTDVPSYRGNSARTSLIKRTPKSSSKHSVSFVAVKSGVKNKNFKTPPSRNITIKEEAPSSDEVTPSNTSLKVNLRSSRKMSVVKKPSPSTPLTAGKSFGAERARRLDNRQSLSKGSLVKMVTPDRSRAGSSPLASSLSNRTSPGARRSLDNSGEFFERNNCKSSDTPINVRNSPVTSRSHERNDSLEIPRKSVTPKASGKITPPRTVSPEVVLRSSKKSASRSMQLSVPGTPTSAFKRNPRRSVKKFSPSANTLRRKLEADRSPLNSAVKKLKLDPDKPDKKKMAALWVCHKKKSPTKTVMMSEQNVKPRRSFNKTSKSPTKFNQTVPRNFKFQASGSQSSSSLLEESHADTSGKPLTPIKDLDALPQQLSPEDDLLNALDLSRKSAIVVKPQNPSRRLRSSTQRRTPIASLTLGSSGSGKPSPSKSTKKLLFRSPLVDYEGSETRGEPPQVNSSNIKSILMLSPTTSSDEPMSRVFTTSPVVDYTDSSGKKKVFRASPTSKSGGIRELIPSEEIDLTGVRDLFEHTTSPSSATSSAGLSGKRGRKGTVVEDQDFSSPKKAKVTPTATNPRRNRGAPDELNSGAKKSTRSVDESSLSPPPSSKSPVRKLRQSGTAESAEVAFSKQNPELVKESESEISFEVPLLAKRSNRKNQKPKPPAKISASKGKAQSPSNPKSVKRVRISVGAAKTVLKSKAVGSKQSKRIKIVESPKKLRSKKVSASTGTAVKVFSSKESPKAVSTLKRNPKKGSAARNVEVVVSPKKLRPKKVVAPKGAAVGASTSKKKDPLEKGSTPMQTTKKTYVAKNVEVASPDKPRSKKVAASAVNASTSKKASATMTVKVVASPKKLRSLRSKEATVGAFTQKESPAKVSTRKKVSTPKRASKKISGSKGATAKASPSKASTVNVSKSKRDSTAKSVSVVASPKKLRSKKVAALKGATAEAFAQQESLGKVSSQKKVTEQKKASRPKRTAKNVEPAVSPKKLRGKEKAGSKGATAKVSTPSKTSTPKQASKKTSTKNVDVVGSPKKLRAKKVVVPKETAVTASSSKKSSKNQTPKTSGSISKSGSPAKKHVAAKVNTKKQKIPTSKNSTPKVSPRKMRSVAKPKKPSPKQVTRRRR